MAVAAVVAPTALLLLCNWYSCYSLGQILYYYQLISHLNPRTIRTATESLHVLQIALTIACAITGHTRTSKSTDYCPNFTQKCVINYTNIIRKYNKLKLYIRNYSFVPRLPNKRDEACMRISISMRLFQTSNFISAHNIEKLERYRLGVGQCREYSLD